MASIESSENVWCDRPRYEEAEKTYQEHLAQLRCGNNKPSGCASSRSPCKVSTSSSSSSDASLARIEALEKENQDIKQLVKLLTNRISALESGSTTSVKPVAAVAAAVPAKTTAAPAKPATTNDDDDDDIDLFGDDDEVDAEAERVKEERLKAYADKKAKKPVLIAKSNIILDVKPWDDETDMAELEKCVRSIVMDGLLWGASKLVPVGYGIKKLQISCVVEDDKVSTEDLEEQIVAFEDLIQSMDIAAFNKI